MSKDTVQGAKLNGHIIRASLRTLRWIDRLANVKTGCFAFLRRAGNDYFTPYILLIANATEHETQTTLLNLEHIIRMVYHLDSSSVYIVQE